MTYLSDFMQEKQTALFEKMGAFYAFSQQQFDESKVEGVEYMPFSGGLFAPKENAKMLTDEFEKIYSEGINNDMKENGKKAIIRRELFNYECFYTGDLSDCINSLKDYGITKEEVQEEYYCVD